jgi:hypothetical protein
MSHHEQYQPDNRYNTSWNIPQALRVFLPGIGGNSGVISHIVDCIGRGQVKSGRKKDGIHDPYITATRGDLMIAFITILAWGFLVGEVGERWGRGISMQRQLTLGIRYYGV